MSDDRGRLKISELAEEAGVPVATVRHYLREGLLPEGEKTSRNMAYYAPELVAELHAEAHRRCYIANSASCPVEVAA